MIAGTLCTSIPSLSGYCAQPNAQLHTKIFLQGGQTKTDKTAKGQDTAKETRKGQRDKSQKERAKESPEKE